MLKYCESIFQTKRLKTREVLVGNVGIGANNPIRIQSMTTSNTRDIEATIDQIIRLADVGCEIVRVTVQGMKEAEACEGIKNGLLKKGYNVPLVADIHFFPQAAFHVIDFVDKVRINPGNFIDKRASFKTMDYEENSYAKEIERLEEKFTPLVEKCKRLNKSMRIGTNHGSLSDRIMNRYGDSPKGMLESALEFARVCRKNDYHNFLFSMKSSNPQVMIHAYRLLIAEMLSLGWDYPLHLGVTEAGEGEDGRIKSAIGIGTLLLDGLGDTIRISLTEDAWNEIDPCKKLIQFTNQYQGKGISPFIEKNRPFNSIERRSVQLTKTINLHRDGSVLLSPTLEEIKSSNFYHALGFDTNFGKPKLKKTSVDCLILSKNNHVENEKILLALNEIGITIFSSDDLTDKMKIFSLSEMINKQQLTRFIPSIKIKETSVVIITGEDSEDWLHLKEIKPNLIFLSPEKSRLHYCRKFFDWLKTENLPIPVILNFQYSCSKEDLILQASAEYGALLCDGLGEGIWIEGPYDIDFLRNLSFNILQASRMRTSKTDFISCPSCGRTLFDLQEVSKRIRLRTAHLPGVKIAIMGCIVNGPGEMADADFGYVGSKPGMIDLYIGKNCVEKDIDFKDADDRLIELIKKQGRWIET